MIHTSKNKFEIALKGLCAILVVALASVLGACGGGTNYDFEASQATAQEEVNNNPSLVATFDPAAGNIPLVNDVFFSGSSDGTLNIPTAGASAGQKLLLDALNGQDGFGTSAPFSAGFSNSMDSNSLELGRTVHVFQVTKNSSGVITRVVRALDQSEMLVTATGVNQDSLTFVPLKPLAESSSYLVILTAGITDNSGASAASDSAYLLTKSTTPLTGDFAALEPLRLLTNQQESIAASQGIPAQSIILSWSFTTLSITPTMAAVAANTQAGAIEFVPSGLNTQQVHSALSGKADVYVGQLTLPYYLEVPSQSNPLAVRTGFWRGAQSSFLSRFNPMPQATTNVTIPVIMSVPNANAANQGQAPEAGWPVVIFQHGIGRDRADLLFFADLFADAGYVMVAIDLPLHGITDTNNPLYADTNPAFANDKERTFNTDLLNNENGATGSDGVIDATGDHVINLNSMPTGRDNLRQGVADLLVLRRSLSSIAAVKLNTQNVGLISYSLGAVIAPVYLAIESETTTSTLAMPGGGIPRLLDNSPFFAPNIHAGLAAAGLVRGTADYDSYMAVFQMVVDAVDPINFGALAAQKHPIHLMEVVGGNSALPDQFIPNFVADAPLSGTEPLIRVMGLPSIGQTTENPQGVDGAVRFTAGTHRSLFNPADGIDVTVEMQTQVLAYQLSGGKRILISNPSVVLPVVE